MNRAYFLDFDGTVITNDTLQLLLDQYGMKEWKELDEEVESGKITEREAFTLQMNSLQVNLEEAIAELLKTVQLRDGIQSFLHYCRENQFPLFIVSAGFKELIEPILNFHKLDLEILSNHITSISNDGWKFSSSIPYLPDCKHSICKCFPLDEYLRKGYQLVYVGDGITDFCVSLKCPNVYAVKNSSLAKMLQKNQKPFYVFESFEEIVSNEKSRITK